MAGDKPKEANRKIADEKPEYRKVARGGHYRRPNGSPLRAALIRPA
jgi:hypothetical protein